MIDGGIDRQTDRQSEQALTELEHTLSQGQKNAVTAQLGHVSQALSIVCLIYMWMLKLQEKAELDLTLLQHAK